MAKMRMNCSSVYLCIQRSLFLTSVAKYASTMQTYPHVLEEIGCNNISKSTRSLQLRLGMIDCPLFFGPGTTLGRSRLLQTALGETLRHSRQNPGTCGRGKV